MPINDILTCRSCNRCLPRSAFAVKYVQRTGELHPRPNGVHARCNDCRDAIRQRIERPEYIIDEATGCWIWNHLYTPNGYGITSRKPRETAHRYMYRKVKGEIPEGLTLDHLCRNRACVNPEHLEPVPQAINSQRSDRAILDAESIRVIRGLKGKMSYQSIANQYGVGYSTIASVMNGSRWSNIADE